MERMHIEAIDAWAEKDAIAVLGKDPNTGKEVPQHTFGRQATIRRSNIKRMETLKESQKPFLYNEYVIRTLSILARSGKTFYGNVPTFD